MAFLSIPLLTPLIKEAGKAVKGLLGVIIGDKEARDAAEAKVDLIFAGVVVEAEKTMQVQLQSQRDVLMAEISGASWMQRNWRPILMLTFTAIIANNYILLPYFPGVESIEFPLPFWNLLTVGVGGYIVGRSVFDKGGLERVMKAYRSNGD